MKDALSDFGKSFIESVRDDSLFVFEGIVSGHMKDSGSQELHQKLQSLSEEELAIVREIAYQMVDLTMHNTLFMFEQEVGDWKISNSECESLADESDGLSGELYSDEGWIESYSQYGEFEY